MAPARSVPERRPVGITGLCLFFAFGTLACVTATSLLLFPGGPLDAAWHINPRGHEGFIRLGPWAIVLLAAVGLACSLAAIGLWRGAPWGQRLAVVVLSVNLLGDTANAVLGRDPRSLIGVPVAGLLIAYLIRNAKARTYFGRKTSS
ncbi:MAG: hypothetical protein ABI968_02355 [Acidobacteriota bacterium]